MVWILAITEKLQEILHKNCTKKQRHEILLSWLCFCGMINY